MIAFVQPFSIHGPGGGARILRSLVSDAPEAYISVWTTPGRQVDPPSTNEVQLPIRPYFGRIEHTRLRRWFQLERLTLWLGHRFERRLTELCQSHCVRTIHAIPHGMEFWYAYRVAKRLQIPFVLNVHDELDYNLQGHPHLTSALEKMAPVWQNADRRIVISEPMGQEYNRRYGRRPYEIITDGLKTVAKRPASRDPRCLRVYMMGSVHMSYEPNFDVLLSALDQLKTASSFDEVRLTVRPGFTSPVNQRGVEVIEQPWGSQADIDRDLAEADVLYLPLPFDAKYASFVRYSLSTKLVTYLGTGLPILYHGPEYSAASRLLAEHQAAAHAASLHPNDIIAAINQIRRNRSKIVRSALSLAHSQFLLEDQQRQFWSLLSSSIDQAVVSAA